jgi:hypothetical protein
VTDLIQIDPRKKIEYGSRILDPQIRVGQVSLTHLIFFERIIKNYIN